jgi:hypothetical protein
MILKIGNTDVACRPDPWRLPQTLSHSADFASRAVHQQEPEFDPPHHAILIQARP